MTHTTEKGKHAPGPWDCSIPRRPNGELAGRAYVFSVPTGEYTAECFLTDVDGANARLIAAAPELLETLRELVAIVKDGYMPGSGDIRMCELAIARAEGKV
jgi:hypothetical protein